ncbi:hypothetical protein HOY82DRAFT_46006 [Tuber indicum]|nr:hypothetical protein HOY82DRAFT_46006 [Tuber indicum]
MVCRATGNFEQGFSPRRCCSSARVGYMRPAIFPLTGRVEKFRPTGVGIIPGISTRSCTSRCIYRYFTHLFSSLLSFFPFSYFLSFSFSVFWPFCGGGRSCSCFFLFPFSFPFLFLWLRAVLVVAWDELQHD